LESIATKEETLSYKAECKKLVAVLKRIRGRASYCLERGGKYHIQTLDAIDEIAQHAIAKSPFGRSG
jgi:hypothetical protein